MGKDKSAAGLRGGPGGQAEAGEWWLARLQASDVPEVLAAWRGARSVTQGAAAREVAARALAESLERELDRSPTRVRRKMVRELEVALGMVPGAKRVGTPGREVSYWALEHAGRRGERIPGGTRVRVVRSGWRVNGVMVVRARVERAG